jgi:hypothetical protein
VWQQVGRTRKQPRCGSRVSAFPRSDPGAAETITPVSSELLRALVYVRDVDSIRVRLLQVVADDLVCAVAAVEVPRNLLVELRALGLRDPAIRDVADKDVVEAQNVLHRRRIDVTSALEAAELGVRLWCELLDLRPREAAADNRRPSQHVELAGRETVETARDQRVDGGRGLID